MQNTTFELFTTAHDALKARRRCTLCNIFQNSLSLRGLLVEKSCLLHETDGAVFLLVPYHGYYHDCLYHAADETALEEGITDLLARYSSPLAIRGSVIAKEPQAEKTAQVFLRQGFSLKKKLLRMLARKAPKKIREALHTLVEGYLDCVSFAAPEEAEEILEILLENFDLVADNVPELPAIRENIVKQQVAVLRRDGKIASLNYFTCSNSHIHGLFDVTRKEYRKEGLFLAVQVFLEGYFSSLNRKIARGMGWRDIAATRLVKHSEKSNACFDGVVIYNMLWTTNAYPTEGDPHP